MAKFESNYEVEGTLQNQTYYKTRGQIFVKRKSGVNKDRIMTDKKFARTRENGAEFGASAAAGKLLRYAFSTLVTNASDSLVTSRLVKVMSQVKNLDTTSPRGQRNVAVGIATAAGMALINGFNFNKSAILKSILRKPFTLNNTTGVINITGLVPLIDVTVPDGATNITFTGAMGIVDFANGTYNAEYTNSVNVPYNTDPVDITLTPDALPAGTGATFFLLHIAFFQQVNGIQYTLNNGGFNALAIIDVQ
jgi:hypothetical protein